MDAAFGFFAAAPTARPWVFAGFDGAGAGGAADGGEALGHQGVTRQAVFDHVFLKVFAAPMGQRVHLDAGLAFGFEEIDLLAGGALIAFAARDPAIEGGKRAFQGFHLAHAAAGISVELVQRAIGVFEIHPGGVGADGAHVAKMQLFGQLALVIQGFLKQHAGVDEQDRGFRRDHGHKVQEHHRFRPERGHERHPPQIGVFQRMLKHRGRAVVLVAGIQRQDAVCHRSLGGGCHVTRHPVHLDPCRARP